MVAPPKSQVSENPDKNAVTRAMDTKDKKADVDRKMRFYGVLAAFREGRYPDNGQIDDALKYTIQQSPVEVQKLSPEGQKLVRDVREIIETARQMVLQKNSNEEFQKFLYASRKADVTDHVGVKPPVSGKDAKKDAETAGEAFRALGKLFLRNGELRKLFQDFAYIGRDVFADAASKAADLARPDEEALKNVDQPAPDNHFHDDIPAPLKKVEKAPNASDVAGKAQTEAEKAIDMNAPVKDNVNNVANVLKANTLDKLPENHKEAVKEHAEKTQEYFKEKFPKERREQFVYRLKKIVVECQRHREYQDAIEFFLTAFEHYKGHAETIASQVESSALNARKEGNVQTAETTFRTLIERFANGKSTQPMVDALDQIYTDVKNDPELRDWFKQLDKYLRNCVQTPGYIMKDEADREAQNIIEHGKKFFTAAAGRDQGKYVPHKDKLFDEVETFFKAMGDDPLNKKFGEDWQRLFQDLFLDAEGRPTVKPNLWRDIQSPILPELTKHIGYVPIPRIEYSDPTIDLVIENLVVEAANLLPNLIEVDNRNFFKLSVFDKIRNVNRHSLEITLSQIQSDMRDIHFAVHKKKGFPSFKDRGTADIFVGGKGLTVTVGIELENVQNRRRRHVFTVKNVKCNVDQLDFAIRHSKASVLVKIVKPLATGLIKKQIKKAFEQAVREGLEKADLQLVDLLDSLDAAKADANAKQMDVLKEKLNSKKEEAKSSEPPKGTFKLATSKRNSILPNMGDKDGWINKVDERTEAAKRTQSGKPDWYSPAFAIVSPGQKDPKNVGNLPPPANVSAKPAAGVSTSINGGMTGPQTNVSTATGGANGVVLNA